ncbi:MAG: Rep family protein, partial [Lactobacillus iners]|nr:Rep family protein [Lactobacillus iners]
YGTIDIIKPFETSASRYEAIREMIAYIDDNNITEFFELLKFASLENEVWFRCLSDNSSYIINQYIKSKRYHKLQQLNEILKK